MNQNQLGMFTALNSSMETKPCCDLQIKVFTLRSFAYANQTNLPIRLTLKQVQGI